VEPLAADGVAATTVAESVPSAPADVAYSKATAGVPPFAFTVPVSVTLLREASEGSPVAARAGRTSVNGPTPAAEIAATRNVYGDDVEATMMAADVALEPDDVVVQLAPSVDCWTR